MTVTAKLSGSGPPRFIFKGSSTTCSSSNQAQKHFVYTGSKKPDKGPVILKGSSSKQPQKPFVYTGSKKLDEMPSMSSQQLRPMDNPVGMKQANSQNRLSLASKGLKPNLKSKAPVSTFRPNSVTKKPTSLNSSFNPAQAQCSTPSSSFFGDSECYQLTQSDLDATFAILDDWEPNCENDKAVNNKESTAARRLEKCMLVQALRITLVQLEC